mmetsp:Transcript_27920/g.38604  ORF Transcript_27920/g.38604 Transcript_27920/m.38604 type:complete len:426 (+) Transcript_27920:107-1384(+)
MNSFALSAPNMKMTSSRVSTIRKNALSVSEPRLCSRTSCKVAPLSLGWRRGELSSSENSRALLKTVSHKPSAAQKSRVLKVTASGEKARKYRRVVFGGPEWIRHRSTNRYLRHIATMFSSRVIRNLLLPVSFFTGLTVFTGFINTYGMGGEPMNVVLPNSPFSLTAGALSLLLVFRTNSSYGRWWEARKIWGGLLNRSRDFVRQGLTWFSDDDANLKEQLVRYTIAFATALKVHLRDDEDMREELSAILLPSEVTEALEEAHVPNHLLRIISQIVWQAQLEPILTTQMDENITFFEDVLGKCERIYKTPIPMSYTRMTSRFLIVWLAFLPLALWKEMGWAAVPVEFMTSLFLLGIEDIGVQIEEPFSILSCEAICGSVENNSIAMLVSQDKSNAVVDPKGPYNRVSSDYQVNLLPTDQVVGFFDN